MADDWPDRWKHIQKLLERSGPFAEADFEPSSEVSELHNCRTSLALKRKDKLHSLEQCV